MGTSRYIRRLVPYLRPHCLLAALATALTVLAVLVGLLSPWPLQILYDHAIGSLPLPPYLAALQPIRDQGTVPLLVFAVGMAFVLTVLQNALEVINSYVQTRMKQRMIFDLRSDLFDHALHQSLAFHDQQRAGGLIYAINFQADAAISMLTSVLPLARSVLTLVGMFAVTMAINLPLALIAMIVVPPLYYTVGYYTTHIQGRLRRVKELEGESLSLIHEAVSMIRVIAAFGRERYEHERFCEQGLRAVDGRVQVTVRQTAFSLAVNTITAAGTSLVLGFGAYFALMGQLTGGELLVVMTYIYAVYRPLESISYTIGALQDQFISLQMACDLLDSALEIADAPDATRIERVRGAITFDKVSFSYSGRASTLRNIFAEIQPGQVVAIVGPTGAGKTTLMSMLMRFYQPSDGRILIDGHDIRGLTIESLRAQISIVLQEPLLFSGTIADNIRYGRAGASMDDIVAAAQSANAHDFIMRLPNGYQTSIGERGVQLSGGERQRICVARAFLKDAPILILDEPTSSVDTQTESVILEALRRLMVGRTTLMIAHRLSTIRDADVILVIDGGQLVEAGAHGELVLSDGLYQRLYSLNAGQHAYTAATVEETMVGPVAQAASVASAGGPPAAIEPGAQLTLGEPAGRHALSANVAGPAVAAYAPPPSVVVLGMMTKMPVAGVVWQTMHYLLGLERLGYEVYYVEAHARTPSMLMHSPADDGAALAADFIHEVMHRFGMEHRWAYQALHDDGRCYGMSEMQLRELYDSAALLINLHGGTMPQPEHVAGGRLLYLETDPVLPQIELAEGRQTTIDFLNQHCAHFTFGENYGAPDCKLPTNDLFRFRPTRQPVLLDFWQPEGTPTMITTIGNWRQSWRDIQFRGETYTWSKHAEFMKLLDMPARTGRNFELALSSYDEADREMLEARGWHVRPAREFSSDIDAYRAYVTWSLAEFTAAKDQNVRLRSGWFSDRSATYLAAGRPVITQETGFSNVLPTGEGLLAFSTPDEAAEAVERVFADYERHSRAAREIAHEYFDAEVVLRQMLREVGL